jgi:LuxR family maltose regulon positive regulatory protein
VFAAAWQRGATRDFEGIAVLLPEILLTLEEQTNSPVSSTVKHPLIEPLSQRELEILQLIADGLNSREVALRLHLGVTTIRWYLRQIYGKLDVHSRSEALARARELNLLA